MTQQTEVLDAYKEIVRIANKAVVDLHFVDDGSTADRLAEAILRLGKVLANDNP